MTIACYEAPSFSLILIELTNRNLIVGTPQEVCTTKACAVAGKKLI